MPNPPRGTFSRMEAQGTVQQASGQQARPERPGPAEKLLSRGGGVVRVVFNNGQGSLGDRVLQEKGLPGSRQQGHLRPRHKDGEQP